MVGFSGSFDSLYDAVNRVDEIEPDWAHIVDTHTEEIVYNHDTVVSVSPSLLREGIERAMKKSTSKSWDSDITCARQIHLDRESRIRHD